MSVSSTGSIWGSILKYIEIWFLLFFQHKNTRILSVHPKLVANMAVSVATFWMNLLSHFIFWMNLLSIQVHLRFMTPNLPNFEMKLLSGNCRRMLEPGLSKDFFTTPHNQKPKYAIKQKERPLRVAHHGHNKMSVGPTNLFRYIIVNQILIYLDDLVQQSGCQSTDVLDSSISVASPLSTIALQRFIAHGTEIPKEFRCV